MHYKYEGFSMCKVRSVDHLRSVIITAHFTVCVCVCKCNIKQRLKVTYSSLNTVLLSRWRNRGDKPRWRLKRTLSSTFSVCAVAFNSPFRKCDIHVQTCVRFKHISCFYSKALRIQDNSTLLHHMSELPRNTSSKIHSFIIFCGISREVFLY